MVKTLREYSEYLVEYDDEHLVVYLSGLDADLYWDEIRTFDEVDNPQDFAQGLQKGLEAKGHFVTITKVIYEDN